MFLPENMLLSFKYFLFGSLFVLFVIGVGFLAWKRRDLWFPLSLVILTIGGHLFLLFTLLYPFKIYSRYMMIASLGVWMIIVLLFQQVKSRIKLIIAGLLIISFIPFFLYNSYAYKNEWTYFQRAKKFMPTNDFVNYQLARIKWDQHDYISTELILNQMLFRPMRKTTAMLVSLIYADIDFTRAYYDKCLRWVESIQGFEQPYLEFIPFIKFQINHQRAMIALVTGRFKEAEKLFRQNINLYDEMRPSYDELYLMLVGQERWAEAEELEQTIREKFITWKFPTTQEMANKFPTMNEEEKLEFYILHRNYPQALNLLEKKKELNLQERFQLAKLYFRMGLETQGNEIIQGIYEENKDNYEVLNMVGSFFIIDFIRIPQGLAFLEQSLRVNPDQQNIQLLALRLRREYIEKIKDPWAGR